MSYPIHDSKCTTSGNSTQSSNFVRPLPCLFVIIKGEWYHGKSDCAEKKLSGTFSYGSFFSFWQHPSSLPGHLLARSTTPKLRSIIKSLIHFMEMTVMVAVLEMGHVIRGIPRVKWVWFIFPFANRLKTQQRFLWHKSLWKDSCAWHFIFHVLSAKVATTYNTREKSLPPPLYTRYVQIKVLV